MGIDEEIENWMRQVYELLEDHRDLAYSNQELSKAIFGDSAPGTKEHKLDRALDVLVDLGAAEKRTVGYQDYYAFHREFDISSWKQKQQV